MSSDSRGDTERKSVLLIATDLSTGGGVNRVIADLAALLHEHLDLRVTVASARSAQPPSYSFPKGIDLRFYDEGRSLVGYARVLWRLRRERFDFAIGPWTQDNLLLTLAFLRSRTRVVLAEHAPSFFHLWSVRLARRLLYPFAWRVVALNRVEFDHYRRYLANVDLIPNPVRAAPPGTSAREPLIIAVGHLTPLKNLGETVEAMALSRLEEEGWSLAIIGDGPERGRLEEAIRGFGLTSTTIEPPTADIERWYSRASLLVHSSTMEVFPMVLAESMAAGVVPIAYDADGRRFILEDFPRNRVPYGDVVALSERLREFALEDLEGVRKRMQQSIEERFSSEAIAQLWRQLLAMDDR